MKSTTTCLLLLITISALSQSPNHLFNSTYKESNTSRIAFPIGGLGAGMFCIEGSGAIGDLSIRNTPDLFNEPAMFAAIAVKGIKNSARVLEGPVPDWKKFGINHSGDGHPGATWGLPRFEKAVFSARFPFATIQLTDASLPVKVSFKAWSPFIPTDANHSSMPLGALEYTFTNTSSTKQEYVFSYNARNFMKLTDSTNRIQSISNGFILSESGSITKPEQQGDFAIFTNDQSAIVDHDWFRGNWFDPLSMAWNHIEDAKTVAVPVAAGRAPGASIFIPFTLPPNQTKTIRIMMAWYVPNTTLHFGWSAEASDEISRSVGNHQPWYVSQFKNINEVSDYWRSAYDSLKHNTQLFTDAFYKSTLAPEITEAVAANLSILKSPTMLRQFDGRLWGWEGSNEAEGSCPGSCTHVYNYAQSICHLFPDMERSLRETEFGVDQNAEGHQTFRAMIPIRPMAHAFDAAADGQLGGIMKVYRDWRISGDSAWLRNLYPKVKESLDYCIRTWDPRGTGTVEEPHHNTYDIEFWGANGFTTSFYIGALEAMIRIGKYLHEDVSSYTSLLDKGKVAMETKLYNGQYFDQHIQWTGLSAPDPLVAAKKSFGGAYSPEGVALLQKEGPKYQYGSGCLSDGVLGAWMARVCGLSLPLDPAKIDSHLQSVYRYNFKKDLSNHANPQRSTYAMGKEGGLLLCTWPRGGKLSLPFVYSDEVWTGIEYQVASHLIFTGHLREGLQIVRTARNRYDGRVRNPFDEYECGHWYARAMSSYALIEACTGVRYDAVTKTLYMDSKVGDFVSFLSTGTGFGNVVYKGGKVRIEVVYGEIDVKKIIMGSVALK